MQTGEEFHLAIATANGGLKRHKELVHIIDQICTLLGVSQIPTANEMSAPHAICEINFDAVIRGLPEATTYEPLCAEEKDIRYQTLSAYPFIVRDIAIFVPQEVTEAYIEALLKNESGDLVVRFSQFDKFQKEGEDRISYGYRMVFQSYERTLTDDEVGIVMERVTAACNKETNWQVR